jgi:hypothetical protein
MPQRTVNDLVFLGRNFFPHLRHRHESNTKQGLATIEERVPLMDLIN